jgi:hypothetical protein
MIRAFASSAARSRIPRRSPARSRAPKRSSTSPRRRTSTARSRSPTRSSRPTLSAHTSCSRRPASGACATCRSRPMRSTARSRGIVHRGARRCEPSSPYSATKAGADLLVAELRPRTYGLEAVICRGSNNYGPYQYPEKLIPLMILNALHGDPLPVYGDGMQVRNWLFVADFAAAIATCSSTAPRATPTTRRSRRVRQPNCRPPHHRADGRRSVADRARHRPARDTTAAIRSAPRRSPRSAGRRRALRGRPRADRRVVSRQRMVVGADPLRRLSRVLRAPVRPPAERHLAGAGQAHQPRLPSTSSR